jgi:Spy/CpxP family protein refolding chaperone
MHPATLYWWKYGHRHRPEWGTWAGCGTAPAFRGWDMGFACSPHHEGPGGMAFGVRRPLRYLAYKLELDEAQVAELARVLTELKTERAQAEVDHRRTLAAFADAVAGETFDDAKAAVGAGVRVHSAERLRDAVVEALRRIHALLDPEQRARLAYLIRTGALNL